jgi:hypothetical protein
MHQLQISLKSNSRTSDIKIVPGIRRDLGQLISDSDEFEPGRVPIFSNKRVFGLYGKEVVGEPSPK